MARQLPCNHTHILSLSFRVFVLPYRSFVMWILLWVVLLYSSTFCPPRLVLLSLLLPRASTMYSYIFAVKRTAAVGPTARRKRFDKARRYERRRRRGSLLGCLAWLAGWTMCITPTGQQVAVRVRVRVRVRIRCGCRGCMPALSFPSFLHSYALLLLLRLCVCFFVFFSCSSPCLFCALQVRGHLCRGRVPGLPRRVLHRRCVLVRVQVR